MEMSQLAHPVHATLRSVGYGTDGKGKDIMA